MSHILIPDCKHQCCCLQSTSLQVLPYTGNKKSKLPGFVSLLQLVNGSVGYDPLAHSGVVYFSGINVRICNFGPHVNVCGPFIFLLACTDQCGVQLSLIYFHISHFSWFHFTSSEVCISTPSDRKACIPEGK